MASFFRGVAWILGLHAVFLAPAARGAPSVDPQSPAMFRGNGFEHPHRIDFDRLPLVPARHAVIHDVRASNGGNQHNYLAFHDGRFWAMWSDGPGGEDRAGQVVKFAVSPDGLHWSAAQRITPYPPDSGPDSPHYNTRSPKGFRWISRGFWRRGGELLALASLDEAAEFFGPSLRLVAFRWNPAREAWENAGKVHDAAINNFPPQRLPTEQWMMTRRAHDYTRTGVSVLIGGVRAIDQWESFPILGAGDGLAAEEPCWWILPDGKTLAAMFRDNRRSGYLYRAFSFDNGRSWTKPVQTDFPDATSKFYGFRLADGRYVLINNPNPKKRDPLTIALSDDGLVFAQMACLVRGRQADYPHAIEHEGDLLVAFSGAKQTVELLKIALKDLDAAGTGTFFGPGAARRVDGQKNAPVTFPMSVARADEVLTLKAMTFNIRYDNPDDGEDRWPNRREAVGGLIRHFQGDFVGVQEALPNQMADLQKMLPEYRLLGRSREADPNRGEATPILYRHERWRLDPERHGWFWLSDAPDTPGSITWGNACPRMVVWGRFLESASGRGVYVFNTHFDHVSEPSRRKSAEVLARRIARREPTDPVVVLGDFNSGESSAAIQWLTGRAPDSPVQLLDTYRAIHPEDKEVGTFHAFRGGTSGQKIDFILASPGAKVVAAAICRDRIDRGAAVARYPSDHFPVTAEMTFSEAP